METPVAEKPKPGLVGPTIRVGVLHALVWAGIFAFLIWRAPAYKRSFAEMDVALPQATIIVLGVSDWLRPHALWFAPLFLIVTGGSVAAVFYVLGRYVARAAAWAWFFVAFLVQVACIAMIYLSLILPMQKLSSQLGGPCCNPLKVSFGAEELRQAG